MTQPLILTASAYSKMISHCREAAPHEACGFLFGTISSHAITANHFIPVPNISEQPRSRFEMDPAALIPLMYNKSGSHSDLIGMVHSHPAAPAVPSDEDLRTGWYNLPSHWIVSLINSATPVIQAYRYVRQDGGSLSYMPLAWMVSKK